MKATYFTMVTIGVLGACSAADDSPQIMTSESSAPSVRQSDYIQTPAGLYHRSCVHEVQNGTKVDERMRATRRDGSRIQIPTCQYLPKRTPPSDSPASSVLLGPTNNGWIENAGSSLSGGATYHKISANWIIPSTPTGTYPGSEVYYTFPGLFNADFILQPVLQYGYNNLFGGSYWSIASWRCGPSSCLYSTPKTASAGDALSGSVTASGCSGGTCTWTIITKKVATNDSTVWTVSDDDDYNKITGGAVEVFGLTSCSQYPTNGVFYSQVIVYNSSNTQIYPAWNKTVTSGLSPSCNFRVTNYPGLSEVQLYHNPAAAPTVTSLVTSPASPKQYLPATYTMNGSGFNTANAEVVISGGPSSSCPTTSQCYIRNGSLSKTSTQLIGPAALSIPGAYSLQVRNGDGGTGSAMMNFTVVP